ncbi:septum site-determining protein MinC [Halorhodospira halochloris]|uniref:septum site-determining protein MinC n=1 Tax=Halorhodospira halochloris TaxID=1052 RepID=UPI001EE7FC5C|nr:septum site-determining protein MinC [Halorhodospira halochloris]MCG5531095.1 septum site-determining protein MinC [Halorhodospira halochloris]
MATTPEDDGCSSPPLELKGRMATLTVVRVQTTDLDALVSALEQKLQEAPNLLKGAPMLIELADEVAERDIGLQRLAVLMREMGAVPVAVRGAGVDEDVARAVGLGILGTEAESPRRAPQAPGNQREPSHDKQAEPRAADGHKSAEPSAAGSGGEEADHNRRGLAPRVIDHPVRSGQQVYARGRDIIVLGAVGTGAEILADGDVHIYGALRGRALAGVQGDTQARIFCTSLDAELVSVAGNYQVSERFEVDVRGKPAQISLDESGALRIEPFGKSV